MISQEIIILQILKRYYVRFNFSVLLIVLLLQYISYSFKKMVFLCTIKKVLEQSFRILRVGQKQIILLLLFPKPINFHSFIYITLFSHSFSACPFLYIASFVSLNLCIFVSFVLQYIFHFTCLCLSLSLFICVFYRCLFLYISLSESLS